MKTILVATDFSEAATNAAIYARDMAKSIHAGLHLLHVYQVPISYSEVPVTVDVEKMMEDSDEEVLKLKNELSNNSTLDMNIDTEVIEGVFFVELKKICERVDPYLVVIGSQGKTPTERFFFGSEAVYTIKHLRWPIIAVPPNATYKLVNKVGFACDFDDVAQTPVEEIKLIIKDFHAELHVLNTGTRHKHSLETFSDKNQLMKMLEDLKPQYHFIDSPDIDESTMNFAEKNQIDLLIVLPKRHSLVEKLIHKSHTKQFVLHSHVPVLSLHKA